jgi:hypothetical protein
MKSYSLLTVTALACSASTVVSTVAQAGPEFMIPPMLARAPMGMMGPSPAVLRAGLGPMAGPSPILWRGIGPMAGPMLGRAGLGRFGGPAMLARGLGQLQAVPSISRVAFNGPPGMGGPEGFSGPPPFARGGPRGPWGPGGPWGNPYAAGLGPFGGSGMGGPPVQNATLWGGRISPMAASAMGPMGGFGPNIGLMHAAFRPGPGGFGGMPPFMPSRVAWQSAAPPIGAPWETPPMTGAPGMMGPVAPFGMPYTSAWAGPMGGMSGGPGGPWMSEGEGAMGVAYAQWVAAHQAMAMGPAAFRYASYRGAVGIPGIMAGGLGPMARPPMMAGPQIAGFGPIGSPLMMGPGMEGMMGPGAGPMGPGNGPVNPMVFAGFGPQGPQGMMPGGPSPMSVAFHEGMMGPGAGPMGPGNGPVNPMAFAGFGPQGPQGMMPGGPSPMSVAFHRGIGPLAGIRPALAGPGPMSGGWGAPPAALRHGPFPPTMG